jgi:hypothetical protein
MKRSFDIWGPWLIPPLVALVLMGGGGYLLNRVWSMGSGIADIHRAADEARMRGIEKRLRELEGRADEMALAFRLDRATREDERQRRIEASIARANAERDARDR